MFDSVRVAFPFLILAVAGSAEAQGDLDRGKTGAQLCISLRNLPQIAAKHFQNEMAFRNRELSARALYFQL
jgi:hypothetical protein